MTETWASTEPAALIITVVRVHCQTCNSHQERHLRTIPDCNLVIRHQCADDWQYEWQPR